MRSHPIQLFAGVVVSICAGISCAQEVQETQGPLRDPTRPPQVAPAGSGSAAAASPGGRIQMLLIGESRKYAVIDGVLLKPGDLHRQWRLSSINPDSVVMHGASGTQVIKANPSVVKTIRSQIGAAIPSGGTRSNEKKPTRRSP